MSWNPLAKQKANAERIRQESEAKRDALKAKFAALPPLNPSLPRDVSQGIAAPGTQRVRVSIGKGKKRMKRTRKQTRRSKK